MPAVAMMALGRREQSRASGWLLWICWIAVLLRLAGALYQGNSVLPLPGIYDQLSYHELARRVATGHGFTFAEGHWPATRAGDPTAHWSFLYTLFLAGIYVLFGTHPVVARILQAGAVGLLHPWLAYRIGHRLFGDRVGVLAAFSTAVYGYFIYYAGSLLTEAFYLVGILWTIDVAFRIVEADDGRFRIRQWGELGLAIGVTVLLRQVFLVFVPALYGCLCWARRGRSVGRWRAAMGGVAVATAMVLLLILPWTVRNYRAFGSFVLLNTNAGFAFYWGNHPIQGSHFMPLLAEGGPTYSDLIPADVRTLDEPDQERALLRKTFPLIAADPGRFVRLSISRAREFFKFWPSADSGVISNVARVGSFGIFMPLMAYGLWLSVRSRRGAGPGVQRTGVFILYVWILVYTAVHLASWTLVRYRLPVDAVLLVFAALALASVTRRFGRVNEPAV